MASSGSPTVEYILDEEQNSCTVITDGSVTDGPYTLTDDLFYKCQDDLVSAAKGNQCFESPSGHSVLQAFETYFSSENGISIGLIGLYVIFGVILIGTIILITCICANKCLGKMSRKPWTYKNLTGITSSAESLKSGVN